MESLARFALADEEGCSWLGGFPAGSADALVIDVQAVAPPRKVPGAIEVEAAEPGVVAAAPVALQQLAYEAARVLAPKRRGFWICDAKHGLGIARLLERFGLDLAPPIIWDRGEGARGGRLRWILPLSRGKVRGLPSLPDLVSAPGPALHERVAEELVMLSTTAGQWVLEPFAATPTLARAALRLGRPWAGANALAAVRGAIASALVAGGARAGELPVRWDGTGVRVRAGSELATQLALEPPSVRATPDEEEAAIDAAVRGPAAPPDELRTGAL